MVMDPVQEYINTLDLFFRIVDANAGPINSVDGKDINHYVWAEDIATKYFQHASSILYLSRKTKLSDFPSAPLEFTDSASIFVLVRASLETFLTFYYVFVEPKDSDEQNLRCWVWRAAGLTTRQQFPIQHIKEFKQQLSEEKGKAEELYRMIETNSAYLQLNRSDKKKILNGDWRLKSWSEIAQSAGLAKDLPMNKGIYKYLCEHAHCGSISAAQTKQASLNKEQERLIQFIFHYMPIVTANFIHGYCQLFSKSKDALMADVDNSYMVEMLLKLGKMISFDDGIL
jgi:hypothetical protein